MSAQERVVGEVPGVFLERISGGGQEEVTSREAKQGVGVGDKFETEWIGENILGGRGESTAKITTDGCVLATSPSYMSES